MSEKAAKTPKILLALGIALLAAGLLFACKAQDEGRLRKLGYVRFYMDANGGVVNQSGHVELFVPPGTPIPEPGRDYEGQGVKIPSPERSLYVLEGWYLGEADADGRVVFGEKWDFRAKVTADTTVYARWREVYYFDFIGLDFTPRAAGCEKTELPDLLWRGMSLPKNALAREGYTFMDELYFDEAMTRPVFPGDSAVYAPGENSDLRIPIYAKWLKGSYTLVYGASDINSESQSANYYLMNDIDDFAGSEWKIRAEYTGTVEGNGHKIRNAARSDLDFIGTTGDGFGLFGKLKGAKFYDVAFEDCELKGTAKSKVPNTYYYAGFFAGSAQDCVFENVTLRNCAVELTNAFPGDLRISRYDDGDPRFGFVVGCAISNLTAENVAVTVK
ncbi:MAG: InlB B-repeat-containing protein [Clostridiales bacterium]|nr:InlB B-repeat-containing protein [Clostridiales bacterium]